MENISEHVRREREARGVTIEELAKGTFISVAVLKDIESGKFDKYKGDELYLKMYLRKIAKYLGLEEKELDAEFEALTQEIQLEEIRQEDLNKRLVEENKKNITISGKVSDTFKDLKNVKPKKSISNKRVYEDRYLLRYFKYALVWPSFLLFGMQSLQGVLILKRQILKITIHQLSKEIMMLVNKTVMTTKILILMIKMKMIRRLKRLQLK